MAAQAQGHVAGGTAPAGFPGVAQGDGGVTLQGLQPLEVIFQQGFGNLAQAHIAGGTAPAGFPGVAQGDGAVTLQGLQPLEIILQQGLGNLAQVIPGIIGDQLQNAEVIPAQAGSHQVNGATQVAAGLGGQGRGGDVLPWRDLRRLSQQLARLLGRANQSRPLPPAGTCLVAS